MSSQSKSVLFPLFHSKKKLLDYTLVNLIGLLYIWIVFTFSMTAQWEWNIIAALLLGWFTADFFLGITHFLMDYYDCPAGVGLKELTDQPNRSTPEYRRLKSKTMKPLSFIIRLAFDFKTHHIYPKALSRRSFPALVTKPLGFVLLLLLGLLIVLQHFDQIEPAWLVYSVTSSFGLFIGQFIHANLHKENLPLPIRVLQSVKVLQSVEKHDIHHETYERYYTVLSGWSDWLVNPIARIAVHRNWVNSDNFDLK